MASLGLLGALEGGGEAVADIGMKQMAARVAENKAAALAAVQDARSAKSRAHQTAEREKSQAATAALQSERIGAQKEAAGLLATARTSEAAKQRTSAEKIAGVKKAAAQGKENQTRLEKYEKEIFDITAKIDSGDYAPEIGQARIEELKRKIEGISPTTASRPTAKAAQVVEGEEYVLKGKTYVGKGGRLVLKPDAPSASREAEVPAATDAAMPQDDLERQITTLEQELANFKSQKPATRTSEQGLLNSPAMIKLFGRDEDDIRDELNELYKKRLTAGR